MGERVLVGVELNELAVPVASMVPCDSLGSLRVGVRIYLPVERQLSKGQALVQSSVDT